jgi:hypothetical protein
MKYYIFVVDGEVASNLRVPEISFESESFDKYRAIMESNPTIVPANEPVEEGWTWDGKNFNPPVE